MIEKREQTIDASSRRIFDWEELFQYKELSYFFTWRDIKVKYTLTSLVFLWAILQPLLMMIIFTFFYELSLHVPSQNLDFLVFVFSGLLVWTIFSYSLTN